MLPDSVEIRAEGAEVRLRLDGLGKPGAESRRWGAHAGRVAA
jgi:hypothetical protein